MFRKGEFVISDKTDPHESYLDGKYITRIKDELGYTIALPIKVSNQVIGVITVDYKESTDCSKEDIKLLNILIKQVGVPIQIAQGLGLY